QLAPPEPVDPEKEEPPTERPASPEDEVWPILFDTKRPGSLASSVHALLRVAGMTRDSISIDMWRAIGSLNPKRFTGAAGAEETNGNRCRTLGAVLALLDRTVLSLSAFGGLAMESMTRGQGWRFLDMGRRLERSLHTLTLLRCTLGQVHGSEGPVLEAVLEVADSSMTYRRRYMSSLQTAAVPALLLADEGNPASLAFQLVALT